MKNSHRFFCSVALIAFCCSGSARADETDDYIKAAMEQSHVPGLSIAVLKHGKLVKAAGYGSMNLEHSIPARPETVYKIGSVSKQFLATGIMLLVQDGKVSVDDRVRKYVANAPESWNDITIRHLLTHTGGLIREAPGFDPHKDQPNIKVLETAYASPLRFKPGEKFEYSNVGYFLLAHIIETVTGKPYNEFLSQRVFTPLGMSATRLTTVSEITPHRSDGYTWKDGKFENAGDWVAVRPSGAFLSTVLDLAKWEQALSTGKILTEATMAAMWTPVTLNDGQKFPYGFGWYLTDWPAKSQDGSAIRMVRHGGTLPGFRAGYMRLPSLGLAVIMLTNSTETPVERISVGIALRQAPELPTAGIPNND